MAMPENMRKCLDMVRTFAYILDAEEALKDMEPEKVNTYLAGLPQHVREAIEAESGPADANYRPSYHSAAKNACDKFGKGLPSQASLVEMFIAAVEELLSMDDQIERLRQTVILSFPGELRSYAEYRGRIEAAQNPDELDTIGNEMRGIYGEGKIEGTLYADLLVRSQKRLTSLKTPDKKG